MRKNLQSSNRIMNKMGFKDSAGFPLDTELIYFKS